MTQSVSEIVAQLSEPKFSDFAPVAIEDDWFSVYEIAPDFYAISEPKHYESTLVSLLVGPQDAFLIDTGCGIGDIGNVVKQLTGKPVTVINTHTHLDHLGGNRHFENIVMFDHSLSRHASVLGASREDVQRELLADFLFEGPRPDSIALDKCAIPPFAVRQWVKDGDVIHLAGRAFQIISTPGEAEDHIALLGVEDRVLFAGDILLNGPIWTHLPGGSLPDLVASYRKLMTHYDRFDWIMPSHNVPRIQKEYLPAALAAAESVLAEQTPAHSVVDPWNRQLRKYDFGAFSFLARP